jgi:histidine phosphotransferase ChpT
MAMSQSEAPDAESAQEKSAAPPLAQMAGQDLAALLAARLCHDFISPASAIVSGLDLLDDPGAQDMRDDAMALIAGSARKLVDQLQFARIAFGGASGAEAFSREELGIQAHALFTHHRGELDWQVETLTLGKTSGRALINLCALAAAALPMGGKATVTGVETSGVLILTADCAGPRARLRPELLAGLNGEGPGDGLAGHWVQAAWTQALVARAGGRIEVALETDRVVLTAHLPAKG